MHYDCLIIDDEKMLADSTAEYFDMFGVRTFAAYGTEECEAFFAENTADILLLDINLQDGSGFSLCRKLRERTQIPILFISVRTSDDDKIAALGIGGDDYIQKPYSLGVLLAKVKAVLKRYAKKNDVYADDRLVVDLSAKKVTVNGTPVKLTAREYRLLAYLIENRGKTVSKQTLFEDVWKDKFTGDGTLNVHVRRLRAAIEPDPDDPIYIITVWGEGYRFEGTKA